MTQRPVDAWHRLVEEQDVSGLDAILADDAVLEFEAEVDGIHVNGVDMIRFDRDGRISDFKVMLRPLKAIQRMHRLMAEMMQQAGS